MCEGEKAFFVTVPHKTRIKLGRAATFQQIPDHGFPVYNFNFIEYDQLTPRLHNHKLLTGMLFLLLYNVLHYIQITLLLYLCSDYIGKIENVYEVVRTKGTTIVKVKLENLRYLLSNIIQKKVTSIMFNICATYVSAEK